MELQFCVGHSFTIIEGPKSPFFGSTSAYSSVMENFKGISFVSFIFCRLYFSYSKNVTDIGKSENIYFIPPIDTKKEER